MESLKIVTLVEYTFDNGCNVEQLIYPNDIVNEQNAVINFFGDNVPKGMLESQKFLESPLKFLECQTGYEVYEVVYNLNNNDKIEKHILCEIGYM